MGNGDACLPYRHSLQSSSTVLLRDLKRRTHNTASCHFFRTVEEGRDLAVHRHVTSIGSTAHGSASQIPDKRNTRPLAQLRRNAAKRRLGADRRAEPTHRAGALARGYHSKSKNDKWSVLAAEGDLPLREGEATCPRGSPSRVPRAAERRRSHSTYLLGSIITGMRSGDLDSGVSSVTACLGCSSGGGGSGLTEFGLALAGVVIRCWFGDPEASVVGESEDMRILNRGRWASWRLHCADIKEMF